MKTASGVLALFLVCAASAQMPPEVPDVPVIPVAPAENFQETRDRIIYSLFFRGEVADVIIEAGLAGRFVAVQEGEPYSELRERMLGWIRSDPDEAARVYLRIKSGGGARPGKPPVEKEYSFEISPHFVGLVKALAAAAGDPRAADEDLSAAGRRLFAGLSIEPDGSAGGTMAGVPSGSGAAEDASSIVNADFKLNKKALTDSARRLGAWADSARKDLDLARGPRTGMRADLIGRAFAGYRGLLGAASSVSGRERITAAEAARLEKLRLSVRGDLSASSLLAAADDLDAMADVMDRRGRPGSARRARAAAGELEGAGGKIAAGSVSAADIVRLVSEGENLYLAASFGARSALLLSNMAERAARPEFSCLYDRLADMYFRRVAPASPYSKARQRLEALGRAAPGAAELAEKGEFEGAFAALSSASGSGGKPEAAAADFAGAMKAVFSISRANARAQYLAAGAFLNPFCLQYGPGGFRLAGLFPGSR